MTALRADPLEAVVSAWRISVEGIVQGVGFRPFVYTLARRHGLGGWVRNTSSGVEIVLVGPEPALSAFAEDLPAHAPPLSVLDRVTVAQIPIPGAPALFGDQASPLFLIHASVAAPDDFVPVSPDVAACDECLAEMRDPGDRRYRYPFINCTNCGPRYTIIRSTPYDRPMTTMASFTMCPSCRSEYEDPTDRRFHAQPNACPVCGPQVRLVHSTHAVNGGVVPGGEATGDDAIRGAQRILAAGGIVAVKGLGGFHLACDAANEAAVTELRRRKRRGGKPFAVMARDLATISTFADLAPAEAHLLTDRCRPILLLDRAMPFPLSGELAPGMRTVGVMLPYTPLHHLLLDAGGPAVLVMTSGNLAEEPIVTDNHEALTRLAAIADSFLLHNREIHIHCDDSVIRRLHHTIVPVRRGRGYAPDPIRLPFPVRPLLAVGGELKNTLCLTRDRYAFLSQHIGDLENLETLTAFERTYGHLRQLFRCCPEAVVCDLHPGYLGTRWAEDFTAAHTLPLIRVQHHHAHLASVMAEHGRGQDDRVMGVIFDGTGYGLDGTIWGGEFLFGGYAKCLRFGSLRPFPLPGGDASVRRPYRTALALLWSLGIPWSPDLPPVAASSPEERRVLAQQLDAGLHTVQTTSAGRLFDAAASLAGVCHHAGYEAQAALEFEAIIAPLSGDPYHLPLISRGSTLQSELHFELDTSQLVSAMVSDVRRRVAPGVISARFHHGLAGAILEACHLMASASGEKTVALSGGVFQNTALLRLTLERLVEASFSVLVHRIVPPNDGGLAVGQAMVAHARSVAAS